jgi:aminoglycoside/choline kinase family phosphotransferase
MSTQLQISLSEKIRHCFGPQSELLSLVPLAGDASSRRYYRAHVNNPGKAPSLIVMQLPQGSSLPLSSEELAVFKETPRELPFINVHRFLQDIGVRVPDLYGYWDSEGILLLEDLGDQALWDRVQSLDATEILAWYRKAIDELLTLQLRGSARRDDNCIAFQQRFDFRLYMWEFDHFLQYGLIKRTGVQVSQRAVAQLNECFTEIARDLDREPACLNHRDYHSWNLMIHNETVAVIDFQDALLAPPQYDLASLLNDRITDSIISADLEAELLRYFLAKRNDLGAAPIADDHFLEIYLLSAIQRDLKVVGRFYYLDIVKAKPAYMKFVPPTLRRLKRNLARLPRTQHLLPLLAEYFAELR